MRIDRNLAIRILKYLHKHPNFYFPFLVMCQEYSSEDNDFVEIDSRERKNIEEDKIYQTFELWENLQDVDEITLELMSKWFIEKILEESWTIPLQKAQFTIDEYESSNTTKKKISTSQMTKILSYIENDEWIWGSIEIAKQDAIKSILE